MPLQIGHWIVHKWNTVKSNIVFWNGTQCNVIEIYWHYEGTYILQFKDRRIPYLFDSPFNPEHRCNTFLRNFGKLLNVHSMTSAMRGSYQTIHYYVRENSESTSSLWQIHEPRRGELLNQWVKRTENLSVLQAIMSQVIWSVFVEILFLWQNIKSYVETLKS
jgi:hypothetical protein